VSAEETIGRISVFGDVVGVYVGGDSSFRDADEAVRAALAECLDAHVRLSRFEPASELSLLNADPRAVVPVSGLLLGLAAAAVEAAKASGGLVDATSLDALERAGYRESLSANASIPLAEALRAAPPRLPAAAIAGGAWQEIEVDLIAGTIGRTPGVRLDSGGLAKGMVADAVAARLGEHPTFAIDAAGDLCFGGSAAEAREIRVDDPFGRGTIATFALSRAGVATSGIGKRSWLDADGRPAHHLIDPAGGRPAFTGIVQATALAPTALEAEVIAKTALLRGPGPASEALRHGGALVFDDGSVERVEVSSELRREPATT
jgi:FAD:protein FMN transferase